jgi:hypothetical protein
MVWVALWLVGPPGLAAVISVGTLLLVVGSLIAGRRKRRAAEDRPVDPDAAWATYRSMRTSAVFAGLFMPFIGAMFWIYADTPLARVLGAGGVAVLWLSGIHRERQVLAHVRDRAAKASGTQPAA